MAEIVEVKIKGTVVTARYGTLSSGEILRTDAVFAKHLVEQCGAGEYVDRVKEEAEAKVKQEAEVKSKAKQEAEAKAEAEAAAKTQK